MNKDHLGRLLTDSPGSPQNGETSRVPDVDVSVFASVLICSLHFVNTFNYVVVLLRPMMEGLTHPHQIVLSREGRTPPTKATPLEPPMAALRKQIGKKPCQMQNC